MLPKVYSLPEEKKRRSKPRSTISTEKTKQTRSWQKPPRHQNVSEESAESEEADDVKEMPFQPEPAVPEKKCEVAGIPVIVERKTFDDICSDSEEESVSEDGTDADHQQKPHNVQSLPSHAPVASEETVRFMESYASWWRSDDTGLRSSVSSILSAPVIREEKVPLLEGFPSIVIGRKKRNVLTKLHKDKPYILAAKLVKAIMPMEELKKMSARTMPPDVMEAVESYVALHCSKLIEKKRVTKAINNMLHDLKADKKRERKKTSDTSSTATVQVTSDSKAPITARTSPSKKKTSHAISSTATVKATGDSKAPIGARATSPWKVILEQRPSAGQHQIVRNLFNDDGGKNPGPPKIQERVVTPSKY